MPPQDTALHPTPVSKRVWLILLVLFWAGFGLTGRDAWKTEEALAFAQVWLWLQDGLLPLHSPLYVLTSGTLARLAESGLDWQDGARLASGLFSGLSILFTALTARALFGPGYGAAATLLLMGAFGFMLRAHALLPEAALMAAYALLLLGIAAALTSSRHGGWLMGLALAGLVLARGLGDGIIGLLLMLGPLLLPGRPPRGYRRDLLIALTMGGALFLTWLAALLHSGQWTLWWTGQWAGLAPAPRSGYLFSMLIWFAWPAWPLAGWAAWHEHRKLGRGHELHLPLLATALFFLAAHLPALSKDGAALPLLLPLTLLAAHGVGTLKRGAAQAFYWFGVTCFLFFAIAFWLYFAALEWGWPAGLARQMVKLVPNYVPSVGRGYLWLAGGVTLLWLLAVPLFPRAQLRPALVWATGMALTWTLLIALFRPWIETGWGYRATIQTLGQAFPADACARLEVDPAARVMFRYHWGSRVAEANGSCDWLLARQTGDADRPGYHLMAEASRPRQKDQVFQLLRRD